MILRHATFSYQTVGLFNVTMAIEVNLIFHFCCRNFYKLQDIYRTKPPPVNPSLLVLAAG